MRCFSRLLAASLTALIFMTFFVQSQPAYDNAPVALLLPNGTIVMVPGKCKSGAVRVNSCLVDANFPETKLKDELKKNSDVDCQICHPQSQKSTQPASGVHPMSFHQQPRTLPLHQISSGINTNNGLLDLVEEWVKNPHNTPHKNLIPGAMNITSKAGSRFENGQMCQYSKAFPGTDNQYHTYNTNHNLDRLKSSNIHFQTQNISVETANTTSDGEEQYNNYLNFNRPFRNEMAKTLTVLSEGDHQRTISKDEINDQFPSRNNADSSDEVISKACTRKVQNQIFSDSVKRSFDFRDAKDFILDNEGKLMVDNSDMSKQSFHGSEVWTNPGSLYNECNAEPFHGSGYNYSSRENGHYKWFTPRTQRLDGVLDHTKKTVSNDYIAGEGHSQSNVMIQRKDNSRRLRLNLLDGEKDLTGNIPLKNKNLEGPIEENYQRSEKEVRRRPDILYCQKGLGTINIYKNNNPGGKYQEKQNKNLPDFDYQDDFSHGSASSASAQQKRAYSLKFDKPECSSDENQQGANAKNACSYGMLGMNAKDSSENDCITQTEESSAEVLEGAKVLPRCSQFQRHKAPSPQSTTNTLNYHDGGNTMHNCVSPDIYQHNDRKAIDNANKWMNPQETPYSFPDNYNAPRFPENHMIALNRQRPLAFVGGNPMDCREKYVSNGDFRGSFGNTYSTLAHKTGIIGNKCVIGSSFNRFHTVNNMQPIERTFELHGLTPEIGKRCYHQLNPQHNFFINKTPNMCQYNTLQGFAPGIRCTSTPSKLQVLQHPTRLICLDQYPPCRASGVKYTPCVPEENFIKLKTGDTQASDSLVRSKGFPWMPAPLHTNTDYLGETWIFPCCPLPPQEMSFATFLKEQEGFWRLIHYGTILCPHVDEQLI